MIIEIGKRYVRRDGSITEPMVEDPWGWSWATWDKETKLVYSSEEYEGECNGFENWVRPYEKVEHPFDLVMEYTEEVSVE